jgi:hypothetical protein
LVLRQRARLRYCVLDRRGRPFGAVLAYLSVAQHGGVYCPTLAVEVGREGEERLAAS